MNTRLDSEPVTVLPQGIRGYGELVIHGEIYKAWQDVGNAVAHHHSMAFLPFCNSGEQLLPLYRHGRADRRAGSVSGKDSSRRIRRHLPAGAEARGRRLARPRTRPLLGGADAPARRDGRCGRNLTELVFRSIYSVRNAELQLTCKAQGLRLSRSRRAEAKMTWDRNLEPRPQARAWEYWVHPAERKRPRNTRRTVPQAPAGDRCDSLPSRMHGAAIVIRPA